MATDYLKLAQEAYEASSLFMDANYRPDFDYSLKAFRMEHASGSKYLSDDYKSRSRLVSSKTRSIIRKNEAAGAVALFSNMDIVNLTAGNPDDIMNVASAAAMKEVLEYRLAKTIPTFPLVMGAIQDAQTTGAVISYQYWEYERRPDGRIVKDKPCIELRPVENIRLDGGASWLDPVGTSPYFCDIIPMYVCDVRAMMNNKDDKTGMPKWNKFKDDIIAKARPDTMDTTRKARLGQQQQDPHEETSGIKSFDIVWVMRWFMRDSQGDDHTFYTLGTDELLTAPKPIEDVYFHGKRPYVMGYAVLETHKVMKTSMPTLLRPLQLESTDIRNQRLDNVKFVLNKRWFAARGRQVDVQSLVRNVPGGVTLMTDPMTDVKESNWPDVTSSSFVEHDRLNMEFDELAGNFSPATKVANNAMNDTLGGSKMAAAGAGLMTDYLLRTIIETWWEPVLRQLVLLEQHYETDDIVLSVAAKKARLYPRFGLSQITDLMMMNEVNLTVNVGMGSSDPGARLQKFLMATQAAVQLVGTAPPGLNIQESLKEIYSNAGYRDGERFWSGEQDPRLAKAMQQIQQMQQALEGKQMEIQAGIQASMQEAQLKIASNERIKGAELQLDRGRIGGDLELRQKEMQSEQQLAVFESERAERMKQLEMSLENMRITSSNDVDIDAAVKKIQSMIQLHEARMQMMLEKSDSEGKEAGEYAKKQSDMEGIAAMHQQFIESVSQIVGALQAKKSISMTMPDGRVATAEVSAN